MLTKEIESGRVKCVKYWPDKDMLYDGIKVVCDDIDSSIKELIVRKFTITNEIVRFQFLFFVPWDRSNSRNRSDKGAAKDHSLPIQGMAWPRSPCFYKSVFEDG